jgi:hypothetical protein
MCIHVDKGKEGAMEKERGKGCMWMDKVGESRDENGTEIF